MADKKPKTPTAQPPVFTLQGLLAKAPAALRPVVVKYGPALVAMTAEEFWHWVELMLLGNDEAAWRRLLDKMPNAQLLKAWKEQAHKWAVSADGNARRVALQKEATLAVLKVLLAASLSWVGL